MPTLSRRSRIVLSVIVGLIALFVALSAFSNVYIDWLWFDSVNHRDVYSRVLGTRIVLFVVFGLAMALIVGANIAIAFRTRPKYRPMSQEQAALERYRVAIEPRRRLLFSLLLIATAIFTGLDAQGRWSTWMMWRNGTQFGVEDPQFHKDISYYAFTYPFQRWILGFLFIAVVISLVLSLVIHYLFGAIRFQTPGEKATLASRVHLSVLLGIFVLLKVIAYYLDRYGLLFSDRGVVTGASYTDINAVLPAKMILLFIALICGLAFIANVFFRNFALPAIALVLLVLSSVLIGGAYPAIVQQFQVKPNANEKEAPFIERNINATRAAYDIDGVEVQQYNAASDTNTEVQQQIESDPTGTIANARLLDPNVLSPTFDQRQRIRNYYSFNEQLDIDRYTDPESGELQDYVVGVRELDPSKLTGNQTNWINQHMVYTHGNGIVAAPANDVDNDGIPHFTTGGLPTTGNIEVDQPRVYFGELFGDNYAIVGGDGAAREVDLPGEGNNDVKNTYDGEAGVKVGGLLNRLVFSLKYRERNILLNDEIRSDSKIIYIRDPRDVVQKVAPFLEVDGDPYPAVIDGRITWIVDGYTTTDRFPYSQRQTLGDITRDSTTGRGVAGQPEDQVNYVRNSVKATVDAYDGTVNLYEFDEQDPILKTWMSAFPDLIQPKSAISPELESHFRYPEDLFKIQRTLLASYHVQDPRQFFNQQNFWEVPADPTTTTAAPQPPYYLLSQIPGQDNQTFQLTSTLTAYQRPNMAAFVSVSSDPDTYGRMRVLELPSDTNINGPVQAQSQFESTTKIAESVNVLNLRGGVIYGNLLTLPVAGGLMYIEPIYVQGEGTDYRLMRKVMVAFGSQIGYGDTLEDAVGDLFGGPPTSGGNGGNGGNDNEPGGTTPPNSTTPPDTTPPDEGPVSPEVEQAAEDVDQAYAELQDAWETGTAQEYQQAQAELRDAIERLKDLTEGGN